MFKASNNLQLKVTYFKKHCKASNNLQQMIMYSKKHYKADI